MADSDTSFLITPEGNLSQCEYCFNTDITGNVIQGLTSSKIINEWKQYSISTDSCKTCCLYPDCIKLKKCPLNGLCTEVHYRKFLKLLQMEMFSTWTAWKKVSHKIINSRCKSFLKNTAY